MAQKMKGRMLRGQRNKPKNRSTEHEKDQVEFEGRIYTRRAGEWYLGFRRTTRNVIVDGEKVRKSVHVGFLVRGPVVKKLNRLARS